MARRAVGSKHDQAELDRSETPATTLALDAYKSLRTEIIKARLPPRQKLKVRELCDKLGIGPSPVREALNRLASEGLVVQNAQRGFSVTGFSVDDFNELTNAIVWLNEVGIRQSIQNTGTSWEEEVLVAHYRLSKIPRYLSGATSDERYNPAWDDAHRTFHISLVGGCGSRWLIGFCTTMFDALDRYRSLARYKGQRPYVDEHHSIMEAAVRRDADKTVELITAHFKNMEQIVSEILEKDENIDVDSSDNSARISL